jgi:hypothetical protein
MMDGDAVRNAFALQKLGPVWKNFSATLQKGQILNYGDFRIEATGMGNQVEVTFQDGIVGEKQIEYLTRITDFYAMLGVNYSVKSQNRCDNPRDIILTGESQTVSSLYIYGVIEKRDDQSEINKKSPLYEEEKLPEIMSNEQNTNYQQNQFAVAHSSSAGTMGYQQQSIPIPQQFIPSQQSIPQQQSISMQQQEIQTQQPSTRGGRGRGGGRGTRGRGGNQREGRRIDLTSRTSGSSYDMIYE